MGVSGTAVDQFSSNFAERVERFMWDSCVLWCSTRFCAGSLAVYCGYDLTSAALEAQLQQVQPAGTITYHLYADDIQMYFALKAGEH